MDWRNDAACRSVDAEIFFPLTRSGPLADKAVRRAERVCRGCPVRRPCLRWAVTHGVHGIWAGTTERDRRAIRTAWQAARGGAPVGADVAGVD